MLLGDARVYYGWRGSFFLAPSFTLPLLKHSLTQASYNSGSSASNFATAIAHNLNLVHINLEAFPTQIVYR
jgi:hypothetical protein